MNSLCNNLKTLFLDANPNRIQLTENDADSKDLSYKRISRDLYSKYSYINHSANSLSELNEYYNQLSNLQNDERKTSFDLLADYGKQVLGMQNNTPFVKFESILEWREITHFLGQPIITTAFLAESSLENNTDYNYFAWPTALKTNNRQLNNIINKGISENHYHLNGSTQIFPITWISIMNNPEIIPTRVKKIESNLFPEFSYGVRDNQDEWESLLKKAAIIRIELFCKITPLYKNLKIFNDKTPHEFISYSDIQNAAERLAHLGAYKTPEENVFLDYALKKDLSDSNFGDRRILAGERKFLYDCFKASFSHKFSNKTNNKFYYYLLVKNRFRREFVQNNDITGFKNFERYQDRKSYFINGIKKYQREAVKLSLENTLSEQSIVSLEARIMPGETVSDLCSAVRFYDNNCFHDNFYCSKLNSHSSGCYNSSQAQSQRHFFVLHCGKGFEKFKKASSGIASPRNAKQRQKAKRCALATATALSRSEYLRSRIYGMDACSNEIGCRPEVFATEYRYLKNYVSESTFSSPNIKENSFNLGRTYHVGEDFLELADGLRAIDEVMLFLDFSYGDRLGHALALGINPYEYYSFKKRKIILPCQDAMDTYTWLYHRANELNIPITPVLKQNLRNEIQRLYKRIYGDFFGDENLNFSTFNLFCAWKLRGDSPDLYYSSYFKKRNFPLSQYERAKYADIRELNEIRSSKEICKLYYAYHFDESVREKGEIPTELEIDDDYIKLVAEIQKKLQFEIAKRGIMIECNPSSNCLIGTFKSYDKHPITAFNNLKLEISSQKIAENPQISVSINTDDQGVFDTSLEYEYALIAAALMKQRNTDGTPKYSAAQVYDYLDNIREMGKVQSFFSPKYSQS